MNVLKALAVVLAIAAAGSLVVGTMGFSTVSAERGIGVDIVDDTGALVGYTTEDETDVLGGDTIGIVDVTNRAGSYDLAVTDVTVDTDPDSSVTIAAIEKPSSIEPGTEGLIEGAVGECRPGETATVSVTVTVEGTGFGAKLFGDTDTRQFTIDCASVSADEVVYFGGGNAEIDRPVDGDLEVTVAAIDGPGAANGSNAGNSNDTATISFYDVEARTESKLREQLQPAGVDNSDTIVGIQIGDNWFLHPQFDEDACTLNQPNPGGESVDAGTDDPFEGC